MAEGAAELANGDLAALPNPLRRETEDLRDVAVGQAEDVAENDDLLIARGQAIDRLGE